jgi:hypothetical protein
MKTLLILAGILSLSIVAAVELFSSSTALAEPAGCCMQRDNTEAPNWYRNQVPFVTCQQLNTSLDNNDDIFKKTGRIWWDTTCR